MEQQASYYDVTDLAQLPEPPIEIPGAEINHISAIYAEPSKMIDFSDDFTNTSQSDFDSIRHWLTSQHLGSSRAPNNVGPPSSQLEKQFGKLKLVELSARLRRHLKERGVGNRQSVLEGYSKFSKKMAQALIPKNFGKSNEGETCSGICREGANEVEENYGFVSVLPQPDVSERKFEKLTGFKLSTPPNARSVRMLGLSQRKNQIQAKTPTPRPYSYYQGQIGKVSQPDPILHRPLSSLLPSSGKCHQTCPTALDPIQDGPRHSLFNSYDLRRRPVVENYGQLLGLLPITTSTFQDGAQLKGPVTCSLDQLAYSWRAGCPVQGEPSSRSDSGYGGIIDPKPFLDELMGTTSHQAMSQNPRPSCAMDNTNPVSTSILTLAAKLDQKEAELETLKDEVTRNERALTLVYEEKIADLCSQLTCALAQIVRHERALGLAPSGHQNPDPARLGSSNHHLLLRELEQCRRALDQRDDEIIRLKGQIGVLIEEKTRF